MLSTVHPAKGREWKAVYVLSCVDGCIPSDLATGTAEGVEEERRLLYVAMTRARDGLHLLQPERFHVTGQARTGDRYVRVPRTRFVTEAMLRHFEVVRPGAGGPLALLVLGHDGEREGAGAGREAACSRRPCRSGSCAFRSLAVLPCRP